jgi:hypothetical protein
MIFLIFSCRYFTSDPSGTFRICVSTSSTHKQEYCIHTKYISFHICFLIPACKILAGRWHTFLAVNVVYFHRIADHILVSNKIHHLSSYVITMPLEWCTCFIFSYGDIKSISIRLMGELFECFKHDVMLRNIHDSFTRYQHDVTFTAILYNMFASHALPSSL